jgi:hypothetical protein
MRISANSQCTGLELDAPKFEPHPAARLFPLLRGAELEALKVDIASNGQRTPIVIWEGKILDGRNRANVCASLGVKLRFEVLRELGAATPLEFVLAMNLHRRHLTATQRAIVAARSRNWFDHSAHLRRTHSALPESLPDARGDARDQVGALASVSGRTVDYASRVLSHGIPEVVDACVEGKLAISTAAKLVTLPDAEQRNALRGGRRAITAAVRCVGRRPSSTSDQLGRLLAHAFALEQGLRDHPAGVRGFVDSSAYDKRLLSTHAHQLATLASRFASLSAELAACDARSAQTSKPCR